MRFYLSDPLKKPRIYAFFRFFKCFLNKLYNERNDKLQNDSTDTSSNGTFAIYTTVTLFPEVFWRQLPGQLSIRVSTDRMTNNGRVDTVIHLSENFEYLNAATYISRVKITPRITIKLFISLLERMIHNHWMKYFIKLSL